MVFEPTWFQIPSGTRIFFPEQLHGCFQTLVFQSSVWKILYFFSFLRKNKTFKYEQQKPNSKF